MRIIRIKFALTVNGSLKLMFAGRYLSLVADGGPFVAGVDATIYGYWTIGLRQLCN